MRAFGLGVTLTVIVTGTVTLRVVREGLFFFFVAIELNIYWLLKLFYKAAEYIGYYLVCYFVLAHIFALLFGAAFAYVLFGKIVFVVHWEA